MPSPNSGPFLPQELLWEILSLLPVKVLMRFRCVCKSWNSLVFDPTFVKLQLQRSSSTNTFIILTLWRIKEMEIPMLNDGDVIVIGVCNGLVCLTTSTVTQKLVEVFVHFWNPATRLTSEKSYIYTKNIFPYYISDSMGFGYDDSRDTYKVIAVVVNEESQETEVKVHCLGDNYSRKVISWNGFPRLKSGTGQYLSGTLNWLAQVDPSNQYVIYSFDLRDETYKYLLLPQCDLNMKACKFGVLNGCLCISEYNWQTGLFVWQMKEFGVEKSWTQLLNVSCHFRPLDICENANFRLLKSFRYFDVVVYNRRDSTLDLSQNHANVNLFDFFDYVHSLVLPY